MAKLTSPSLGQFLWDLTAHCLSFRGSCSHLTWCHYELQIAPTWQLLWGLEQQFSVCGLRAHEDLSCSSGVSEGWLRSARPIKGLKWFDSCVVSASGGKCRARAWKLALPLLHCWGCLREGSCRVLGQNHFQGHLLLQEPTPMTSGTWDTQHLHSVSHDTCTVNPDHRGQMMCVFHCSWNGGDTNSVQSGQANPWCDFPSLPVRAGTG